MRLIIAEDEVLLRAGLTRLLADEGYDVVATASTGPDLVTATLALRPDLVITETGHRFLADGAITYLRRRLLAGTPS